MRSIISLPLLTLVLVSSLTTSGCSAIMAASGNETPDLSVLHQGTPRKQIETVLGKPLSRIRNGTGDVFTYQYFDADPANSRRAAFNAGLALVTLGFSEIVTAPAEMVQGDRHVITARFGENDRLLSAKTTLILAPIDVPENIVGLQEGLRPDRALEARNTRLEAIELNAGGSVKPRLIDVR